MEVCVFLPSLLHTKDHMARQQRAKSGTGIYHIMLRGINRQDFFVELVSTPVEECDGILDIDTCANVSVSDSDIKLFLLERHGIANPLMVQSLERVRRNEILRSARTMGAGIRQLSRLTGISFGVIQKL